MNDVRRVAREPPDEDAQPPDFTVAKKCSKNVVSVRLSSKNFDTDIDRAPSLLNRHLQTASAIPHRKTILFPCAVFARPISGCPACPLPAKFCPACNNMGAPWLGTPPFPRQTPQKVGGFGRPDQAKRYDRDVFAGPRQCSGCIACGVARECRGEPQARRSSECRRDRGHAGGLARFVSKLERGSYRLFHEAGSA